MFVSSFQFNSIFWKYTLFVSTYHQIAHHYSKYNKQILLLKKNPNKNKAF